MNSHCGDRLDLFLWLLAVMYAQAVSAFTCSLVKSGVYERTYLYLRLLTRSVEPTEVYLAPAISNMYHIFQLYLSAQPIIIEEDCSQS